MKLVVALALSAHAFSPATPGGAKPREKVIPTSSAAKADPKAGATGGTFGMFSDPMTADDFVAKL